MCLSLKDKVYFTYCNYIKTEQSIGLTEGSCISNQCQRARESHSGFSLAGVLVIQESRVQLPVGFPVFLTNFPLIKCFYSNPIVKFSV